MRNNSLFRQLKIDLITGDYNPIIEWFNDLYSLLYVIETDVYHTNGEEFIYYTIIHHEKHWIYYRDDKRNRLWCNYNYYWSSLERKFGINYQEIQEITKILFNNILNKRIPIRNYQYSKTLMEVDIALINNVATPSQVLYSQGRKIEHFMDKLIV